MRLALLRQGLFLWQRRRLRPRQAILGVPDFERHGVAAARPNLYGPSANVGVAFEKPVEPAAVIWRLQFTSWDLGQAA
jgi:hypothetical protein